MANTSDPDPPPNDVLSFLGGVNPLTVMLRSAEQLRKGATDLVQAVETFTTTMRTLGDVANRLKGLLDTFEEPMKAWVPQITRTAKAADALVETLSNPVQRVAPGLERLAEMLSSPTFTSLPVGLEDFFATMNDLSRRLTPLGQIAEAAGGMFGMRGFGPRPASPATVSPSPPMATSGPSTRSTAKKTAPTKKASAAKKTAPRKRASPAKKTARRRSS